MKYTIGAVAIDKVSGKLVHTLNVVYGSRPPGPNSEDIRDIVLLLNSSSQKDTMFVDVAFVMEGDVMIWEDKDEVIAQKFRPTKQDIEDYMNRASLDI